MASKLVLAIAGDWEGLYIDGTCVTQGHSVSADEVLCILKDREVTIRSYYSKEVNSSWIITRGDLPDELEDVIWADQEWSEDDDAD